MSPALPAQPPAAVAGNPPREAGINTPSLEQLQAPGSQAVKLLKYFFFGWGHVTLCSVILSKGKLINIFPLENISVSESQAFKRVFVFLE